MSRWPTRASGTLTLALLLAAPARGSEGKATAAEAGGAATKAARAVLARFDKGDPGWKVRMESLARLVQLGPAAVPALVDALRKGPPSTREFAAQALVLFAEPGIRPALEQALADPEWGVRIYAIQALSMLGRLAPTERNRRILRRDPNKWGVRPMMAAALARDDKPDPAGLRRALAGYDLGKMDSARLGETAPDFTLTDCAGKTYRLSQFRGKRTVILRFLLFDY
jgi:hypothetical protein